MDQSEISPSDKKYLNKMCNSLVSPRPEAKLDNEDNLPIINIPSPSGENIAIAIKKAENPLDGNPIILFAHGDGEIIDNYFSYHDSCCPYGVSFCIFDYRGCGHSEGSFQTSGVNETEDCFTVINYLKSEGYGKFSFFGRSMGATCGIFVASKMPDLVCLALDSPMIDFKDCEIYQANRFSRVPIEKAEELYPRACQIVKEKHNIDFMNIENPIDAASRIKQPVFVTHGRRDHILPFRYSEKLMEVLPSEEKKFVPLPNDHNDPYPRCNVFNEMFIFILQHYGVNITKSD